MSNKPELADFSKLAESDRKLNLLVDITQRLDRLPRHIFHAPMRCDFGKLKTA